MNLLLSSTASGLKDKLDHIPDLNLSEKKVLCITTAARVEADWEEWLPKEIEHVKSRARTFSEYDITGKTKQDLDTAFKNYDMVYVTGGNTFYLMQQMRSSGFKEAISKKLEEGATYFGTSAGASVACPDIDYMKDMDDASQGDAENTKGLNLVDFLILPHAEENHPHFADAIERITGKCKNSSETLICLRDDQALWINGRIIRII